MRRTVTTAARASATIWSDVVSNPDLRRLEIGRVWSVTAESIAAVGLAVYGFTTSGALAVAALVTVQYLPGALAAPWLSGAADRLAARLLVLDGEDCLSTVGEHPVSSSVARSTADTRLQELAGLEAAELAAGQPATS